MAGTVQVIVGYSGSGQPIYQTEPAPPIPPVPPPAPAGITVGYTSGSNPQPIVVPAPITPVVPIVNPPPSQPLPTPPIIAVVNPPIAITELANAPRQYLDGQSNESLLVRDALVSPQGLYYCILQTDGNFVIYKGAYIPGTAGGGTDLGGPALPAIWASKSYGNLASIGGFAHGIAEVRMQTDGNFVGYYIVGQQGNGIPISNTPGSQGRYAVMQDDGNLVVYTANGSSLWDSFGTHDKSLLTQVGTALAGGIGALGGIITGNPGAIAGGVGTAIGGNTGVNGAGPPGAFVPPPNTPQIPMQPLPTTLPVAVPSPIATSSSPLSTTNSKTIIFAIGALVVLFFLLLLGDE